MSRKNQNRKSPSIEQLEDNLDKLKLKYILEHYSEVAKTCARENKSFLDFLGELMQGESSWKHDRFIANRISKAKFPKPKRLEDFDWTWPTSSVEHVVKTLSSLDFISSANNVILVGNAGLGKSHIAIGLGYKACLNRYSVLFTTAIDMVNDLVAATHAGTLKRELRRFQRPDLLILDELGYLPLDKIGGDLLFQVVSQRYETGSIIITSNRVFKHWTKIFNNDSTLTSAFLDRLLHHSETIKMTGRSYRTSQKA